MRGGSARMADEIITRQIKQLAAFAELPEGAEVAVQGDEGPVGRYPLAPLTDALARNFIVETFTAIATTPIPVTVVAFDTLGYHAVGDWGYATSKRVGSAPSHASNPQSAVGPARTSL